MLINPSPLYFISSIRSWIPNDLNAPEARLQNVFFVLGSMMLLNLIVYTFLAAGTSGSRKNGEINTVSDAGASANTTSQPECECLQLLPSHTMSSSSPTTISPQPR